MRSSGSRVSRSQPSQGWIPATGLGALALAAIAAGLGLHRRPRYIRNYREEQDAGTDAPPEPVSVLDGLAVYRVGTGEPVLLLPYPHAHTARPMAQEPLAQLLVRTGRAVITFDPPGAFASTREPVVDMAELLHCADEALQRAGITGAVDVVGHSMGALAALAFAVERPERVRRLVLIGGVSGFPAAARWGLPGSAFRPSDPDYWRIVLWGMRLSSGRADLVLHKRLQNLMESTAYHDPDHFRPIPIRPEDAGRGVPVRMRWTRNMYRRLSYAGRLAEIDVPTLVMVGRYDTYAPVPCAEEIVEGIDDAQLVVFEESGHAPFVEEPERFNSLLKAFLEADNLH